MVNHAFDIVYMDRRKLSRFNYGTHFHIYYSYYLSETYMGIKIVQTMTVNLLTSIDPSQY